MGDHERTLQIEYDITMKTKLILKRFGGTFGMLRFDDKSFLHLIGTISLPKQFIDSAGVYTSDRTLNLSTFDKIHLKSDVIDGSVLNGIREPILFSFDLDKPAGYKVFCEPETIHFKKKISLF